MVLSGSSQFRVTLPSPGVTVKFLGASGAFGRGVAVTTADASLLPCAFTAGISNAYAVLNQPASNRRTTGICCLTSTEASSCLSKATFSALIDGVGESACEEAGNNSVGNAKAKHALKPWLALLKPWEALRRGPLNPRLQRSGCGRDASVATNTQSHSLLCTPFERCASRAKVKVLRDNL